MAITFPVSPSINDTYTVNGVLYTWDGVSWDTSFDTDAESLAIIANTAKVSIIEQQSADILVNNDKTGANPQATNQGNLFNGNSQLVKTDVTGKIPIMDGSQLINLTLIQAQWNYITSKTVRDHNADYTTDFSIGDTELGENFDWDNYDYKIEIIAEGVSNNSTGPDFTINGVSTLKDFKTWYDGGLTFGNDNVLGTVPIVQQFSASMKGKIVFEQLPIIPVSGFPEITFYSRGNSGSTNRYETMGTFRLGQAFISIDFSDFGGGITDPRMIHYDVYKRKKRFTTIQL
jgi:hypothetical protein